MERHEVVVVGGGPAGSACALELRRLGHDVLLLDAARFPRDKVCGEGISPEAWPALQRLGLDSAVGALQPQPLLGMRLRSPGGTEARGQYGQGRAGFAVERRRLDSALLESASAAGVEVRQGVRVTAPCLEGRRVCGVRASAAGGRETEISARLVIAADGRGSVVARRLGLLRDHPWLRKFAARGYWAGVEGLTAFGELHVGVRGYCGLAPLSGERANVTFVLDRRDFVTARGGLTGFYERALRRWPALAERLEGARLEEPPRALGPLALASRGCWRPGLLLVGDAAGFFDPFTGEGVTLALRSASWAARAASRALLDGRLDQLGDYARERTAATRDKFRLNRLLYLIVALPRVADQVARRLKRRPDLADRVVAIAGDFAPARGALSPRFLWALLAG